MIVSKNHLLFCHANIGGQLVLTHSLHHAFLVDFTSSGPLGSSPIRKILLLQTLIKFSKKECNCVCFCVFVCVFICKNVRMFVFAIFVCLCKHNFAFIICKQICYWQSQQAPRVPSLKEHSYSFNYFQDLFNERL